MIMTSLQPIVRGEKETSGHVKSEWLGAEARIHISPHRLAGNRLMLRTRRLRIAALLLSFCSGIATGSCLALVVCSRFGSRDRRVGYGKRAEPFKVSREAAPLSRLIGCMIVLLFSLTLLVPSVMAQVDQVETSRQTIKGDVYGIKDISGRLVYLHVDKNTMHERLLVPGEKSKLM
jgi:hypothetical protein